MSNSCNTPEMEHLLAFNKWIDDTSQAYLVNVSDNTNTNINDPIDNRINENMNGANVGENIDSAASFSMPEPSFPASWLVPTNDAFTLGQEAVNTCVPAALMTSEGHHPHQALQNQDQYPHVDDLRRVTGRKGDTYGSTSSGLGPYSGSSSMTSNTLNTSYNNNSHSHPLELASNPSSPEIHFNSLPQHGLTPNTDSRMLYSASSSESSPTQSHSQSYSNPLTQSQFQSRPRPQSRSEASRPGTTDSRYSGISNSGSADTAAATEFANHMKQQFGSGEEDFQLTSAIRYDPKLYYDNYVDEKATKHMKSNVANGTNTANVKRNISDLMEEARLELEKEIITNKKIPDSCFFLLPLHQKRLQFGADFFNWDFELSLDMLKKEIKSAMFNTFKECEKEDKDGDKGNADKKGEEKEKVWNKAYKIRALVSKTGALKMEVSLASPRSDLFSGFKKVQNPRKDPVYDVVVDTQSTMSSPFTSFKTTKREIYSTARENNLRPPLGKSTKPGPPITSDTVLSLENPSSPSSPLDAEPRTYPSSSPMLQEVLLYNTRDEIMEGSITNVAFFREGSWRTPPLGTGCLSGVVRHHLLTKQMVQEAVIPKKSLVNGEPVLLFNGVQGIVRGVLRL